MTSGGSGAARSGTRLWLEALATAIARQGRTEWFGSPPHLARLRGPRAQGFQIFPRDFRPAHADAGLQLAHGVFAFAGENIAVGEGGEPWNRPSPSRAFAEALHGFEWLRDLCVLGPEGSREALRLVEEWRRLFGRWSSFAWGGEVLDRRVVNLACALGPVVAIASAAEVEMLAELMARQARQLLIARDPAWRITERTAAAALAGSAIAGRAGEALLIRALPRLERLIPRTVLADGGHVSRSPEAGLELLFDLLALDDGLEQRGVQTPEPVLAAID
ncbi:MAG TPA: heparinase, partial [Caulobacteraceae bacterium]|nr:heparinase [Caulobacteraceae bacterium]